MTETSFLLERAVGRFSCLAEVEVTAERTGKILQVLFQTSVHKGAM